MISVHVAWAMEKGFGCWLWLMVGCELGQHSRGTIIIKARHTGDKLSMESMNQKDAGVLSMQAPGLLGLSSLKII